MLELMDDKRRAEIKTRFEAATQGPWYADYDGDLGAVGVYLLQGNDYGEAKFALLEDAEFCAHARTDLPDLYAENSDLRVELERVTQAKQSGRMIELPEFPQDMDDILEPLKVQSALNSEVMKLNFRKEHKPKDVSILDYTIIAALYKALTDAETAPRKERDNG